MQFTLLHYYIRGVKETINHFHKPQFTVCDDGDSDDNLYQDIIVNLSL